MTKMTIVTALANQVEAKMGIHFHGSSLKYGGHVLNERHWFLFSFFSLFVLHFGTYVLFHLFIHLLFHSYSYYRSVSQHVPCPEAYH